ncbi:hypothetical protein ES703_120598 [subsurface metagenome]
MQDLVKDAPSLVADSSIQGNYLSGADVDNAYRYPQLVSLFHLLRADIHTDRGKLGDGRWRRRYRHGRCCDLDNLDDVSQDRRDGLGYEAINLGVDAVNTACR